ncbi:MULTISPECIES: hypothetical protein [Nocardioides]|uniref:AbiEi antitoxin C-terminal domain-containing protein n=1 Tax=Nocardioides vastitatis TaxID=2568655 RepID=A0ABW0Z9H5_9ACTN|nr:hypothetical protein [Nocardioides sp.]
MPIPAVRRILGHMFEASINRPGVVAPVRIDPSGSLGPTPGQARGPRWRRVGPGWYVPAGADAAVPEQRTVEVMAGMSGSAATGWAALRWVGGRWFNGLASDGRTWLDVPVALGDERAVRPRQGAVLSEDWLFKDDVTRIDGLRVTIPERSVTYEARRARDLIRAVQVIDMAACDDLVDLGSLGAYAERLRGRPGMKQLRHAVGLADENVWSPQETAMRIIWTLEGVPRPLLCNRPVFDLTGRHLFTPDLLDVEAGVAGEYDGVVHLEDGRRRRDLDRDELTRRLGIEVVTMMAGDRRETHRFLGRLRGAYQRARERRGPRAWTIEQPAWWVDTSTVARRRALTERERSVWLRRRAG